MEAGGSQAVAVKLSKEMRAKGIDAETWFIYKKSDTYMDEEKITIIHDRAPKTLKDAYQIISKLVKKFKEVKPDGVISYTHYATTLGHIASVLAGVKNQVATMQNPVWTYPKMPRMLNKLMAPLGFYHKIIAPSNTVAKSCESYSSAYRKLVTLVYNGVPPRISPLTKAEARSKFNLKVEEGTKLLVNVGRLHPQKNHILLLEVMKKLEGYKLAVAGTGELRAEYDEFIAKNNLQDKVTLFGEIKPVDIPDFLRSGDVFVFPSNFEAFGIVLFEAGNNGLPIVASNIPSTVEVLETEDEGAAGIIVEDNDTDKWVAAIKCLEDPKLYSHYKELIEKQSKKYDFGKWVESYVEYATKK